MIKYIKGSWFEFQHHNKPEGVYWNRECTEFNEEKWDLKIREIAELGMEYLVLMITGYDFGTYYNSRYFDKIKLGCEDPLEIVLSSADRYGIKFFIGGGIFGVWKNVCRKMEYPEIAWLTQKGINEVAEKYAHHKSFYGWYWPDEPYIDGYYPEEFMNYVDICNKEARLITPRAKILIAPYGTKAVKADGKYAKQLELLNVDYIAYQDEIGVRKTNFDESARSFEALRKVHDKVPNVALWADVEIFEFESDIYTSPLLPASFERILKQFIAVSPYVDNILVYQYEGMMNKPGTAAFAGHSDSTRLYSDYADWLKKHHPDIPKVYSV